MRLSASPPFPPPRKDLKAIEQQLKRTYKDKVLTIRGFYADETLVYDGDGNLVKGGKPGPWTLMGRIEVRDIKISTDTLRIFANRVWLRYDKKKDEFRRLRSKDKVRIELSLHNENTSLTGILATFNRMFLWNDKQLLEDVPEYWKPWLSKKLEEGGQEQEVNPGTNPIDPKPVFRVGGDVTSPVCLYCPDPEYSHEARAAKTEGVVVLWGVVNEEGRMDNVRITMPLGMGLDEAAVEATRRWRFKPATREGKPVVVQMAIEIKFNLY